MPSQYQITIHPLPSLSLPRPTSSRWTRSRGCLANNGQNPSIVLKSRSNKCAAKFVNKSTSQPGAASPPHRSFLLPEWPYFSSLLEIEMFVYAYIYIYIEAWRRRDVYAYVLGYTVGNKEHIKMQAFASRAASPLHVAFSRER